MSDQKVKGTEDNVENHTGICARYKQVWEKLTPSKTRDWHEFNWSSEKYTPADLIKSSLTMPLLVRVCTDYTGENQHDRLDKNQLLLVLGFGREQRVLCRDDRTKLHSVSLHWPVTCRVKEQNTKRCIAMKLKALVETKPLPVQATFDQVQRCHQKSRLVGLEFISQYDEFVMQVLHVENGRVVQPKKVLELPLYIVVRLQVAIGLMYESGAKWAALMKSYQKDAECDLVVPDKRTHEIHQYDYRYYMFNQELSKTLPPGKP